MEWLSIAPNLTAPQSHLRAHRAPRQALVKPQTDQAVLYNIDRNMGPMTSLLQKLVHGNFSEKPEPRMMASDRSNDEKDRHSVQSEGTDVEYWRAR